MSSAIPHTELAFEQLIVAELTGTGGWDGGDPTAYDRELGLYSDDAIGFITTTQTKKWERLTKLSGGEAAARTAVLKRLAAELDKRGAVKVLRNGIRERGISLSLCQLRPAHSIDPETAARYEANRLRVVRQVRYEPKSGDALDLVLFVNGVPTATAELKNRWTSQTVEHAMKQYRTDRDSKNVLLARRAFVHFAIDAELAYMSTRLDGPRTVFLPFNQGTGGAGKPGGAGNPGVAHGHPTSYVWREVWQRDRWLELIQKFVHVEEPDATKGEGARASIVFPRYHQWHVVTQCQWHATANGAGHNYLIQHSAGSGKTKEIAWLAHDLSTLHADDLKVFDKVIVITDRRVLDRQMRQQISQFEQVAGVVRSVTDSSKELLEALRSEQAKIITTTLQKFPFVLRALDEEDDLSQRTYAVVVDEAHSSQSGEAAADLKQLLGNVSPDDLDLDEDDGTPPALLARLAARGRQPNLSFFAFTATPKGKTLELFGSKGDEKRFKAFHTYSMRQAIEEGFIVDVLANYTTYEQLFRLENQAEKTIEVPSGEASRRLAKFTELHPYVKTQKAAVVVEHFKRVVRPLLGGEGKAMVVCESREEAVQWKRALDREIERHGHDNVKALVAFSGEVTVKHAEADNKGLKYTEPEMNKIAGKTLPESKLPDEFDKPAYGVLVVAEKYQTGFDQPKLCGMYVDKKLVGVNAVQTLSRLNRSARGKDEVYVLDFRNTTEEIRKAFEPFYECTEGEPSEPNVLFDAADAVREFGAITDTELEAFIDAWAQLEEVDEDKRHAILSTSTQQAYLTAQDLEADKRREFREALNRFVRFYGFLSQALPWIPGETEVLFQFSKVLLARLRSEIADGGVDLSGTVTLTHYRLSALDEDSIKLAGDAKPLKAITGDGGTHGSGAEIPMGELGQLVELFNERYGAELGPDDALAVVTAVLETVNDANPELAEQAQANSRGDFISDRDDMLIDAALSVGSDRERQARLLKALLDDDDFRERAGALIFGSIYDAAAGEASA